MFLKKSLFYFFVGSALLAAPAFVSSQEKELCTKEMLLAYFPEPLMTSTLEKFKVPEAQRGPIIKELAEKDSHIVSMVEERAAKMTPNPLKDPKMRQEAVKLFRETLQEVFSGVMNRHGVNNKEEILGMLEDLQKQKAKQYATCMERHKNEAAQQKKSGEKSNTSH